MVLATARATGEETGSWQRHPVRYSDLKHLVDECHRRYEMFIVHHGPSQTVVELVIGLNGT